MEELTRKVLERGGKVCLIGDAKQLQPIEAGQSFTAIAGILGEARLTRIIRQRNEVDREAVRAFSRGEAKRALESYAERGLVHVAKNRGEAMRQMVADWAKDGTKNPRENLLLCSTNLERSELNRLAQAAMREAGRLGKKKVRVGGDDIHEGDRVTFFRNNSFLGVENGDSGRVVRIGTKPITRHTFHGKQFTSLWAMLKYAEKVKQDKTVYVTVELDKGKTVQVSLERYREFRLGYSMNTHHAQGATVDRTFLLAGGEMTSREAMYVQASRSRDETRIYADQASAGEGLAQLARNASKSRAKDLAHDHLSQPEPASLEVQR
jgi:ATP-dependent exoDNAse (exonuclease V) alpha subunit